VAFQICYLLLYSLNQLEDRVLDMSQLIDFHVGVDLVEHDKLQRFSFEEYPSFYKRVFTHQEVEYCLRKVNPTSAFAGLFAAKEAAYKALSPFVKVFISDFEIRHTSDGIPQIGFRDPKKEREINFDQYQLKISISHTKSNSVAFAMCQAIDIKLEGN
jgi:holo-[acyl-carrier protein] synthase